MKIQLSLRVETPVGKLKKGDVVFTTERKLKNFLSKPYCSLKLDGDKIVQGKKILYTVIKTEAIQPPKWEWLLTYWIHGTYEGDDLPMEVKFRGGKPTEKEIEDVMRKGYAKYADDPDGSIFENMKKDYRLVSIK